MQNQALPVPCYAQEGTGYRSTRCYEFHLFSQEMIHPGYVIVMVVGLLSATAQEVPDFTDPDVKAPIVEDLSKRPKIEVAVSDKGDLSINGVAFSSKQVSVVLGLIVSQQPKIVVQAHLASREAFRYHRKLVKIASAEGIHDFTFKVDSEEQKPGEQASTGQPATRSESDSEGGDKPQPEAEGRPR